MKNKIIFTALTLMLSATLAIGQFAREAKPAFGILGGVNFQNLNGKDASGDMLENDMIVGYHVGVNVDIPIVPEFYFQPGLLFSTKGAKISDGAITETFNLSYLELPLNFVYKGLLGTGYVMVGFGPYVGYGLMGKAKYVSGPVTLENDIEFKNTVEIGDSGTYFKRLDVGGNIFVGYETAVGLFFQLNAQLGMLNINPEDNRPLARFENLKNTGFGLSLGYRF